MDWTKQAGEGPRAYQSFLVPAMFEPFASVPLGIWQAALLAVSPTDLVKRANLAAFLRGREIRPD